MNSLYLWLVASTVKVSANDAGIINLSAGSLLTNILNLVYFISGGMAVIVIIVAGIMYTLSSGDTGKLTRSKNMLTYSIVGLVIVLCAFLITNFVVGRFK